MRKKFFRDPYSEVLQRFNQRGIRCVVVGMSGINFYAKNPASAFSTLDYDLFLEPTLKNVGEAVRSLKTLGFTVGTAEGTLKSSDLGGMVRDQRTLVATSPEGLLIDLLLKVSGYPFSELSKDAATFTVGGVPVRVGRLSKLIRSKKLAGRPKDRRFLQRYQALLEE
ncbi:MAG: hypothetical protein HYZ90_06875 [Candidatus Omnitrophica bacterium]|nr:hypothetical protein [Candidatus Omnitrophota bacterium]